MRLAIFVKTPAFLFIREIKDIQGSVQWLYGRKVWEEIEFREFKPLGEKFSMTEFEQIFWRMVISLKEYQPGKNHKKKWLIFFWKSSKNLFENIFHFFLKLRKNWTLKAKKVGPRISFFETCCHPKGQTWGGTFRNTAQGVFPKMACRQE